jgi:PIN domain-containing protein
VPIRFYVDADLLGVAKILVQVRSDLTYPGDPGGVGADGLNRSACPVQPGARDVDWIPHVAREGWVIISRDRHIQHRPAERTALVAAAARMFRLDARQSLNKWQQLEIIVTQWRRFEQLANLPGPWLYMVTRTSLRKEI